MRSSGTAVGDRVAEGRLFAVPETMPQRPPGADQTTGLLGRWARWADDRPAVVDPAGSDGADHAVLTYGELATRVEALAHGLHAAGVRPGDLVAVLLDRSPDTVVAMLAALTVGAVYSPLDVDAPVARTRSMLARLDASAVIATEAHADALPDGPVRVAPEAEGPPERSWPMPPPDALAYVLHTSGSTGSPKAVAMPHRGLRRLIDWQLADGPPGLRTLQFTASSFDVTFQELLSTVGSGGCLVLASDAVRRDPARLLDVLVEHRVERLFLPYVALQLLASEVARRGIVPPALQHVVTAGERLVVTPAIRALFRSLPGCRLDNHYGPTEAHLVTRLTLPADPATWPAVPAIGTAVSGVDCQVLDDELMPVAAGRTGELYVAGDCLADGYRGDPARTAERFVADPAGSGRRMYRTGDMVRRDVEGLLEFEGRADDQIKVRGHRVEPAEVEAALLSHPGVDAAAVGLRAVTDQMSVLVGYVQCTGPLGHRELTAHMRELVPEHMIPARYVPVAEMPRTTSGKVDVQTLAARPLPEPEAHLDTRSLSGAITALWARVLGHDEFDADDDFFDVGGDSLLATWVVAEIGRLLGRPVPLSQLLECPTVEELVEWASSEGADVPAAGPGPSQIVTLRPGPSGRTLYLLHPLGGELLGYRELARQSAAPVRVLGVGWTGSPPEPGATLADIAGVHVEQLRAMEGDGPFRLAGWSFGGVLAFEVARILVGLGAEVEFLGLFDANPVQDPITGLPMGRTPFLELIDSVLARLDDPASTADELAELTTGRIWVDLMGAPVPAGTPAGHLRAALAVARSCMDAAMHYSPQPYPGTVHLFQAEDVGPERLRSQREALSRLCTGSLSAVAVPGDHWAFVRGQHVRRAAAELDSALERVGTAGSGVRGS